ncbi:unnamed protein product [Trifolium pratense]|uniref:Uncharacterized protein n=1 Tax=Trifolium pratense TaxID=57577 RepID=A0ACB0L1A8_TRIPR|nr:unnamed protein product [Trifolium pratense]
MHSDLHSAGYFLNPQFQYGVEHGDDVYKETFEGTARVITKLVRSIDDQIKALNQLTLYREKSDSFGTRLAQDSWSKMRADSWWGYYGTCAPELQFVAIKVVSQKTSATNCERNWKWLHIEDTDDEIVEVDDDNNESNDGDGDGGGLSPPSGNSGNGGGNEEAGEGDGGGDDEEDAQVNHDPYGETPLIYRRYRNLTDMHRSNGSLLNSGGDVSHSRSRRGKRKQNVPLEDSSSSSIAQSFSDFGIDDSSQNRQQSYPPIYQYPYFNSYDQYASDQAPSNYQQTLNYQDPYYEQSSGGFFGYVFGQGATQDNTQSESTSNAPPRRFHHVASFPTIICFHSKTIQFHIDWCNDEAF